MNRWRWRRARSRRLRAHAAWMAERRREAAWMAFWGVMHRAMRPASPGEVSP